MTTTDHEILLSIIIPAYNVEEYIGDTLESICKNKLNGLEIVVIDDGSTDNTRHTVEECLERINPPHYRIIGQDNKGVSAARNVGIDNAVGKYLIFCDGDDLCYPNLVESITASVNQEKNLIVWGFDITQDCNRTIGQGDYGDNTIPEKEVFKAFLMGKYRIRLGSFAVKKSFLDENNIRFTEGCPLAEDVEFIFKCLSKAGEAIAINKILFTYAKRGGSAMYTYCLERLEVPRVIKRIGDFVEENTDFFTDDGVRDYLRNGFLIQHAIYAFDSCIGYLNDRELRREFLHAYYDKYSDIEEEIKRASKEMIIKPTVSSHKKVKLFCINRSLYVTIFSLRMNGSK